MGLESGSFIATLVSTNPVGATDPKSQGDDHIRLIKKALQNSFPRISTTVEATPAELNLVVGATEGLATLSASFAVVKQSLSAITSTLGTAAFYDTGTTISTIPVLGVKSATTTLAGLVEQSTSAENLAGTDDTVFPSVAGVTEMITEHAPALPAATASVNGYMTSTYAAKLDGIAAGANVGIPADIGSGGAVGVLAQLFLNPGGGGSVAAGATISGASLRWPSGTSSSWVASASAPSGTWRNVGGVTVGDPGFGVFQRIS